MQKYFLFFLILIFIPVLPCAAQNFDSLERVITAMPADTAKVMQLCKLSRSIAGKDPKKGRLYASEALGLSRKLRDGSKEALSLVTLGNAWRYENQYDSTRKYLLLGLELGRKTGYHFAVAHALNNLGIQEYLRGDLEKSLTALLEALKVSERIGEKVLAVNLLNNIGLIYIEQNNHKLALEYFRQAFEKKKETGDKRAMASILNNIAMSLLALKDTVQGIKCYEESLVLKRELGDKRSEALTLYNLGDAYVSQKKYREAQRHYNEALAIQKEIDDQEGMASTLKGLGTLAQRQGLYAKAIELYEQSLVISEKLEIRDEIRKIYRYMAETYSLQGAHQLSAGFYKKYVKLSEEITAENNARQIAEMQARYDSEKKEKALALLNQEKQADAEKNTLVQRFMLSGLGLLGCLLFVAFIGYRQKRKANVLISRKNNLLEMQKVELEQQKEEILAQRDDIEAKNATLEKAFQEINAQKNEILEKNMELEQQQEEILAQRDHIEAKNLVLEQANTEILAQRNELEKAYDNIRVLSQIGQKITATLDVKAIVQTVYEQINQIMPADGFGIGIYSPKKRLITFEGFIEKNEVLPLHQHDTDNANDLAALCIRKQQEIVINNLSAEYSLYISEIPEVVAGEIPQSLIYLPLTIESHTIGVITVQSFEKDAYTDYHLSILHSLASYIAIGLDNASAYQTIEAKNTHITDSIRYAQTIQQAILPAAEKMKEAFADFFVLYQPKDVVSGDFYWFSKQADRTWLAAIDCTGHGVPGAFMSLIGNTILNKLITAQPDLSPGELLGQLHTEVRIALRQEASSNDDGMDVCVVCIQNSENQSKAQVTFAGAKRPLYFVNPEGMITELKGDGKSIGGRQREAQRIFANQQFSAAPGTTVYLSTDGFTDQNNRHKEKLGSARFRELLRQIASSPMTEQEQQLRQTLARFQEQEEQRDDVTILGIRI